MGGTYIRLCRAANDPNTPPTDPKIPLEERIDSRAPYPTKSLMNRLRRIAFSDEGPHKLKRGRPPIGRSQEFRDNRAVLDFWYDFMRKVEAEFGNDASLAVGPREALDPAAPTPLPGRPTSRSVRTPPGD